MKLTRASNQGARAIVKLVEQQTGKELDLAACMAIAAEVQTAINKAAADPKIIAALELAEKWLCNCVPTTYIPGPGPLPPLRAALTKLRTFDFTHVGPGTDVQKTEQTPTGPALGRRMG